MNANIADAMERVRRQIFDSFARHPRAWTAAVVLWTALSAFAFETLWIFYEPYSMTFYLEGRGSFSDMSHEEVSDYVRFGLFVTIMSFLTVLPAAAWLFARHLMRKGRV